MNPDDFKFNTLSQYLTMGQEQAPLSSGLAPAVMAKMGVEPLANQTPFVDPNSQLGDPSMDFKTKASLGLGLAQTGLNAYLGFQNNKLAKKQFNESQRQFNTNLDMQKNTMRGNLSYDYATSQNASRLGSSEADYMSKWGL